MTMSVMDNAKNKRLLATERGEPNAVANNPATAAGPLPDPEVSAKPQRRRFTPAYKARIVEEALACTEQGSSWGTAAARRPVFVVADTVASAIPLRGPPSPQG